MYSLWSKWQYFRSTINNKLHYCVSIFEDSQRVLESELLCMYPIMFPHDVVKIIESYREFVYTKNIDVEYGQDIEYRITTNNYVVYREGKYAHRHEPNVILGRIPFESLKYRRCGFVGDSIVSWCRTKLYICKLSTPQTLCLWTFPKPITRMVLHMKGVLLQAGTFYWVLDGPTGWQQVDFHEFSRYHYQIRITPQCIHQNIYLHPNGCIEKDYSMDFTTTLNS